MHSPLQRHPRGLHACRRSPGLSGTSQRLHLCADIGGTHTRLALAGPEGSALLDTARYENRTLPDLASAIADFLGDRDRQPQSACLALAGPADGRRVSLTNLAWEIDADALAARFGFPVHLINDFAAVGHGLDALQASGLHPLQARTALPGAPRIALGAGTGLGVVQCVMTAQGYSPVPSEGGHIGFAPVDAAQDDLLRHLRARHGRVSLERILSGPGIEDLYAYCRTAMGRPMQRARSAAEVTAAAGTGSDATAVWAMQLFCAIYGQSAGDLALLTRATGGVYLAGGIAARIVPLLEDGRFMAGFRAKGRFSAWMHELPVYIVTDPDLGLKGAAVAAQRLLSRPSCS